MEKYKINGLIKKEDNLKNYVERPYHISPQKEAMIVALLYGILGFLWVLLSDEIIGTVIKDLIINKQIQTYKGLIYVFATTIFIYILVKSRMDLIHKAIHKIISEVEALNTLQKELSAMEVELIHQKELMENIFQDAPVIIGILDEEGQIESMNPKGLQIFGYDENEIIGNRWLDLLMPDHNVFPIDYGFENIKQDKKLKNHESKFVSKEGQHIDILWNSNVLGVRSNNAAKIILTGTDITQRKVNEETVRKMAFYDLLTGLPNRIMFENEVNRILREAVKKPIFAVVFLDVDNFKYINDTLGHQTGDIFLKYIANCIMEAIEPTNLTARVGGDKFAVFLNDLSNSERVTDEISRIRKKIDKVWSMYNHDFFISFSVGVALYPKHSQNTTDLLRKAEMAMYNAKKEGKGNVIVYSQELERTSLEHMEIAKELQYAIENEEFSLYYQPQYNLKTCQLSGLEVLIRWLHPTKGFISPSEFIPIAEETGQIFSLERWIIRTALDYKSTLEKKGYDQIEISINLSSKTLTSDANFQYLEEIICETDADLSKIIIEITETAIIKDVSLAISRLSTLKKKGIRIALDDFGTGYSSITYLRNLPIDVVKLDRSFIKQIEANGKDQMIIKSLLLLTQDLGYEVVAEGIETIDQLEYLIKYGCDMGQGYLLSKPMPIEQVELILGKHKKI